MEDNQATYVTNTLERIRHLNSTLEGLARGLEARLSYLIPLVIEDWNNIGVIDSATTFFGALESELDTYEYLLSHLRSVNEAMQKIA